MRPIVVATLLSLLAPAALAIDHPIDGDKLRVRDAGPDRRTFFFRAGHELQIVPGNIADPTVAGATVQVFGDGAGDGDSGVIVLPADRWRPLGNPAGSKGYYYLDRSAEFGINKVRLMPCENTGGSLKISARGPNWPFLVTQPQGTIRVRLTIADRTWCARVTDLQPNEAGKLVGKKNPAPPDCN
jgi:hypothetical protein